MATFSFREYSDTQANVEIKHQAGKEELIITLSDDHAQVTITENEEELGTFLLHKEGAQNLVDWLRKKGFVS